MIFHFAIRLCDCYGATSARLLRLLVAWTFPILCRVSASVGRSEYLPQCWPLRVSYYLGSDAIISFQSFLDSDHRRLIVLGFVHIDHIRADAENLRARLMNSSYVAKEDLVVSNHASATRRVVPAQ